ncbi:Bicoid-interacting protein 3-domain-containing protein, partial [Blyttiomyces helicus]
FSLGNYDNYYGKRTAHSRVDPRLAMLDPEWFRGARVLDVGCNSGFVTVAIGAHFSPAFVEGVDVDPGLIKKARLYLAQRGSVDADGNAVHRPAQALSRGRNLDYFPLSCPVNLGPLPIITLPPPTPSKSDASNSALPAPPPLFPHNVRFRCGNWLQEPNPSTSALKFDAILLLSVTKWIHLNWGDEGIRRLFRRCYHTLEKGGRLILEPQPLNGYKKRADMSDEMKRHFTEMKLVPDDFERVLLEEVGFAS